MWVCMRGHVCLCVIESYYSKFLYLMCCNLYFLIDFHTIVVLMCIILVFQSDVEYACYLKTR